MFGWMDEQVLTRPNTLDTHKLGRLVLLVVLSIVDLLVVSFFRWSVGWSVGWFYNQYFKKISVWSKERMQVAENTVRISNFRH